MTTKNGRRKMLRYTPYIAHFMLAIHIYSLQMENASCALSLFSPFFFFMLLAQQQRSMQQAFQNDSIKNSRIDCNWISRWALKIQRPIWFAATIFFRSPFFSRTRFHWMCAFAVCCCVYKAMVSFDFSNLNFCCVSHQPNNSVQTTQIKWANAA